MPEDYFREVYGKALVSRVTSLIEKLRGKARKPEGREALEMLHYLVRRIDEKSDKCDLESVLMNTSFVNWEVWRWAELEEPYVEEVRLLNANLKDFFDHGYGILERAVLEALNKRVGVMASSLSEALSWLSSLSTPSTPCSTCLR